MYAIEVESVVRIIQIPRITPLANAHSKIDGMMVHDSKSMKVVNFRRITDLRTHEDEIAAIFKQVKKDHEVWVDTLTEAIFEDKEFRLTTDPHACRLGKWLDNYSTHDPEVLAILRRLIPTHSSLHETGKKILEVRRDNLQKAQLMIQEEIAAIYAKTSEYLDTIYQKAHDISAQMQKLLIYQNAQESFAIKVDTIEDIVQIDEATIKEYDHVLEMGSSLRTSGVIERSGKLIIVIESVTLPSEEIA